MDSNLDRSAADEQLAKKAGYLMPPNIVSQDHAFTLNAHFSPPKEEADFYPFESAEHQETARAVELFDIYDQEIPIEEPLLTVDAHGGKVDLLFGQIIALAGDFYTNKEGPESYLPIIDPDSFGGTFGWPSSLDSEGRFLSAVESLIKDKDGHLRKIATLITTEHDALREAVKQPDGVAIAYHEHKHFDHCAIPTDDEYIEATSGPLGAMSSTYAWIAYTNSDHFGEYAVKAYCVGHTKALATARNARNKSSDAEKMQELRLAYVYEAFAAHFLTDLFSSGHLRAPRRPFHNPDYVSMALGKMADSPQWDFQCRYMHDDDSATGLLVRNRNGDQWIEYGDKQFMEPQALVNRARCMHCLKESAAEVYRVGFEDDKQIESWEKSQEWFVAMNLLPLPMTAITPQNWLSDWGGYDKHNPAPLWLSATPKIHTSSGWTVRTKLDDHSNYGSRQSLDPGNPWDVTRIKEASFVTIGQFPLQTAIVGLLTGSFIQIQDLDSDPSKGTCLNFWAPAKVQIIDKQGDTFTIRNRLIDQSLAPTGKLLHWMRAGSEQPGIYGLSWVKTDDSGEIRMKGTWYTSEGALLTYDGARADLDMDQSWAMTESTSEEALLTCNGGRADLDLKHSWAMTEGMVRKEIVLLDGVPGECINLTRFGRGNFRGNDDEVLALCFKETTALIGICGETNIQIQIELPKSPYGFVKTFRGANSPKESILLAGGGPAAGSNTVDLVKIDLDAQGRSSVQSESLDFEISENDASILVGDVLGRGYDQVVALAFASETANISIFGQTENSGAFQSRGTHSCTPSTILNFVGPVLTALVPALKAKAGLDILQISRYKNGSQSFLVFRTHFHSGNAANDPFTDCSDWEFQDPLATQAPDHYFSIKWMPVVYETATGDPTTTRSGVLEVFSWFGVLGVRVFDATDGDDYGLVGQLPHLGQTSIGSGRGCYGDWGYGFVTWDTKCEWVDANTFHPDTKDDLTTGTWGMTQDDVDRSHIRGWQVEERPVLA